MPTIGEIKRGHEIGYKRRAKYIWHACVDCGKERWVRYIVKTGQPQNLKCISCSERGRRNPAWKGKVLDKDGYVCITLQPDDFFYPMVNRDHYVKEHRLVMAQFLGRCLHPWEIVHHKNRIKDDNRIENLQLVTDDRHKQISILENRIAHLEKRVTQLEAENVLLRQQLPKSSHEVIDG